MTGGTGREQVAQSPSLRRMNLVILHDAPDRLMLKLPLAGNENHFGTVLAGNIAMLTEVPYGILYLQRFDPDVMRPVVGEITVRFHAPAFSDLFVDVQVDDSHWDSVEERTRAEGRSRQLRTVEVTDRNGNLNATARITYFSLLLPD